MPDCPICAPAGPAPTLVRALSRAAINAAFRDAFGAAPPPECVPCGYAMYRCLACALEFAAPPVPGAAPFYEWLAGHDWYFPGARWEWNVVIEHLRRARPDRRHGRLLEVGCGSGMFLGKVRDATAVEAIGLDMTPAVVDACRARGFEAHEGSVGQLHERLPGKFDYAADVVLASLRVP